MGGWRQDELELALELGVSPRRLSGWEPREVTRYEYENGRIVGSVTEREPEFSRADVEAMIAYTEKLRVGSHGQPMSEATSREADPSNRSRTIKYEVDTYIDFAKQAENQARENHKREYGEDADMASTCFVVRKVELPAR